MILAEDAAIDEFSNGSEHSEHATFEKIIY